MYAIVNTGTNQVVAQKGQSALTFTSLVRVDLPNGDVVFSPTAGYTNGLYKIFEVTINATGSGPIVTDADPVYNSGPQTVTIARTLSFPPPAPSLSEIETIRKRAAFDEVCKELGGSFTEAQVKLLRKFQETL